MLDPVSLRLFVHVAETGTIAAGAERCHIVTSAASKRIAELENALGTRLLRRTNRGVEPTAAGAALVNMARRVLDELQGIHRQIEGFSKGIRGHVRMFASISAISQLLPGELASFLLAHPDIHIHFEERDSGSILKAVAENLADVGVSVVTEHAYELQALPYHSYQLAVLVPRRHPLAKRRRVGFAATLAYPHIGLKAGSATNAYMVRKAAELNRSVDYRMYVESYDAMAFMVEAGLGIGIVPAGVVRRGGSGFDVTAVRLEDAWASRELRIYVPSYEGLPPATRLVVDHLRRKS